MVEDGGKIDPKSFFVNKQLAVVSKMYFLEGVFHPENLKKHSNHHAFAGLETNRNPPKKNPKKTSVIQPDRSCRNSFYVKITSRKPEPSHRTGLEV